MRGTRWRAAVAVAMAGLAWWASPPPECPAEELSLRLVVNPSRTEVHLGSEPIALTARSKGKNLTYEWKLTGPGRLEGQGVGKTALIGIGAGAVVIGAVAASGGGGGGDSYSIVGTWSYLLIHSSGEVWDEGTFVFSGTDSSGTYVKTDYYGYQSTGIYTVSGRDVTIPGENWNGSFTRADHIAGTWPQGNMGDGQAAVGPGTPVIFRLHAARGGVATGLSDSLRVFYNRA